MRTGSARIVAVFALAFVELSLGLSGCVMKQAEGDLAAGRYEAVLRQVHGTGAQTYRLRGMAYAGLGKTEAAIRALRISRKLDGSSVVTLRALATLEARRGLVGAALRDLQRAFALDPQEPPKLRHLHARLLALRAALRLDPARPIGGRDLGLRDLELARTIDPTITTAAGATPTIAAQTAALHARPCPGPPPVLPRATPACLPRATPACPPRATPASLHGRTPASWPQARPGQGRQGLRCRLPKPRSLIVALRRRDVLLACHGSAIARRLEAAGCFAVAIELWRAMQAEADPHDPRWALQVGRVEVARDRLSAARMAFEEHLYLLGTKTRAAGALAVAEILRHAGRRRHAAKWALKGMILAQNAVGRLGALRLLAETVSASDLAAAGRVAVASSPELATKVAALVVATQRAAWPATQPATRLSSRPATQPATRQSSRPATRPATGNRK